MRKVLFFILIIQFGSCRSNPVQFAGTFIFAMEEGVVFETIPEETGDFEERSLVFFSFKSKVYDTILNNFFYEMPVWKLNESEFLYSDGYLINKYYARTGHTEKLYEIDNAKLNNTNIINLFSHNNAVFYFTWSLDTIISLHKITGKESERVFETVVSDIEYHSTKARKVDNILLFKIYASLFVHNLNDLSFATMNIKYPVRDFEANDSILVVFDNDGMYLFEIERFKNGSDSSMQSVRVIEIQHHPLNRIFVMKNGVFYFNHRRNKCYEFDGMQFQEIKFVPVFKSNNTSIQFINNNLFNVTFN